MKLVDDFNTRYFLSIGYYRKWKIISGISWNHFTWTVLAGWFYNEKNIYKAVFSYSKARLKELKAK